MAQEKGGGFDPSKHLIKLPGRGQSADYLEVKWRLVWFRDKYPHGTIVTESLVLDYEKGLAIFRATVGDGEGGLATGTGADTRASLQKTSPKMSEDFVERSETRAIGRALAALGIGTQFVGEEMSEAGHVADAPVAPSTNGHADGGLPMDERLSKSEVDGLYELMLGVEKDRRIHGMVIRQAMHLAPEVKITKSFLIEEMTRSAYSEVWDYFAAKLKAHVESDVPNYGPHSIEDSPSETVVASSERAEYTHSSEEGASILGSPERSKEKLLRLADERCKEHLLHLAEQVGPGAVKEVEWQYSLHPDGVPDALYDKMLETYQPMAK